MRLTPDGVIVDSESPTRDTLEHLATDSSSPPRPVVVFSEDPSHEPMQQALQAGVSGCAQTPAQREVVCTLATLADTVAREGLASPAIVVLGDVVKASPLWSRAGRKVSRQPVAGRIGPLRLRPGSAISLPKRGGATPGWRGPPAPPPPQGRPR